MRLLSFLLLIVVPLSSLADDVNNDSTAYLNPTLYKSLADISERYHDGQRLTGCYVDDYFSPENDEYLYDDCENPFYWDEHGNLRNMFDPHLPSRAPFPLGYYGLPETYKPAPCEGCLNEEQVIDIMRVYHQFLGIKPLGYRAMILQDFPWNGNISITYSQYYKCVTDYPYNDLAPYQRVNVPRKMRPFTGEGELRDQCRDPQNRDLTWMIQFQTGWIEEGHYLYHEDYPTTSIRYPTPCIATHYIHAKTGWIIGSGSRDRETGEFKTGHGTFYFGHPDSEILGYGFDPYSTAPSRTVERCSEGSEIDNYHDFLYPRNYARRSKLLRVAYLYAHELLFQYLADSPRRRQLQSIFKDFRKSLRQPPAKELH